MQEFLKCFNKYENLIFPPLKIEKNIHIKKDQSLEEKIRLNLPVITIFIAIRFDQLGDNKSNN